MRVFSSKLPSAVAKFLSYIGVHQFQDEYDEMHALAEREGIDLTTIDPEKLDEMMEPWRASVTEYERGWFACERARANDTGAPILKGRRLAEAIHGRTMLIQLVLAIRAEQQGWNGHTSRTFDGATLLAMRCAENWIKGTDGSEESIDDFTRDHYARI